jgi:hypothetical protein
VATGAQGWYSLVLTQIEHPMKTLTDYQGRAVRLTDERLAHILEHPEMVEMEPKLEETLREPQRVVRSRTDTDAALNYRLYFNTLVGDKWLCVVVKYLESDAFVLTAFLTDKPKTGEVLWPRTAT